MKKVLEVEFMFEASKRLKDSEISVGNITGTVVTAIDKRRSLIKCKY